MSDELIPGFASLGFRIPADDRQRFEQLLKSLWAVGTSHPAISGECVASSGEAFRVWSRFNEERLDLVLEVPAETGMIAQVESIQDRDLVKVWFRDPGDDTATEPLFPAIVKSPLSWFANIGDPPSEPAPFSLTLLAREAGFFPNREALAANPDFANFSSRAIIPTGLFVGDGETARPNLYVIGEVVSCSTHRNELTDDVFHVLRVLSLGGELSVALPQEALTADMTHWIVVVEGIASGTFPDRTPAPEPIPESGVPRLDSEKIEEELRRLVVEFFQGKDFDAYFTDIHVDGLTRFLCLVFGVFSSAARKLSGQRGRATPKLAARYRKAARTAPIVMARIVMANTMLLNEGKRSPALVVIAFGDGADEAMDRARTILARIHFENPETDHERALAKLIEDETYQFGKRRRLPEWLVGDVEAYAADLWVPAAALAEGGVFGEWLPCLAEPGGNGLTAAIPFALVKRAINRVSGPPPVPKVR